MLPEEIKIVTGNQGESTGRIVQLILEKAQTCDVLGRAAQLAYYLLFALFPTLIFVAVLVSALPMPRLFDELLTYIEGVLPPQAFGIIRGALEQTGAGRAGGLLSISLLATIWAASSGMEAIVASLNAAYQARSSRGWWRERLLAILLTLGLASFVILALAIVFFGGAITNQIARINDYGPAFLLFWHMAQWPIAAGFVLFGLDLIYYFAPNIRQRWRWVTMGAAVAVVLWLMISIALRLYLTRYSNFNVAYGALGSFMVLMLWLYLTSATILLGGVINGVLNNLVQPEKRAVPVEDRTESRS
ncbi:MAG: YihY/virulence factor BrkB family protein [Acidobacteriota bacterium]